MKPRWMVIAVVLALAPAAGRAQQYDPAVLQQQAAQGNATAAFELGTLEYVGINVVQDYVGAVTLLRQAAGAGNAEAACEAGFLYQTGSVGQGPPPPDPGSAAIWYGKAASAGNACGEFGLAALYAQGRGVAKSPRQAETLFGQAAAQGFSRDPASFPLEQLQERFYAAALHLTGQTQWVDTVSASAGGGG